MAKFRYRARNGAGDGVEGGVDAENFDHARKQIRELGYEPIAIDQDCAGQTIPLPKQLREKRGRRAAGPHRHDQRESGCIHCGDTPYNKCWTAMLSAFEAAGVRIRDQNPKDGRIRGYKLRPRGLCAQALFRQAEDGKIRVELDAWFLRSEGVTGALASLVTADFVADEATAAAAHQKAIEISFRNELRSPTRALDGAMPASVLAPPRAEDVPPAPGCMTAVCMLLGLLSLLVPVLAPPGLFLSWMTLAKIRASGDCRAEFAAKLGFHASIGGCVLLIILSYMLLSAWMHQ